MHRVDTSTASLQLPAQQPVGTPGYFTQGDGANIVATYPGPDWMNAVQEELCGIVEGLGGSLDKAANGQIVALLLSTFFSQAGGVIGGSVQVNGNVNLTGLVDGRDVALDGGVLDGHVADLANPHGVTKTQVGLGSVQNYAKATQAEAESGSLDTRYMTPLQTLNAMLFRMLGSSQQAWADYTASRTIGTTYTNSTGRPIAVAINFEGNSLGARLSLDVDGGVVQESQGRDQYDYLLNHVAFRNSLFAIVPPGSTFKATNRSGTNTVISWKELR